MEALIASLSLRAEPTDDAPMLGADTSGFTLVMDTLADDGGGLGRATAWAALDGGVSVTFQRGAAGEYPFDSAEHLRETFAGEDAERLEDVEISGQSAERWRFTLVLADGSECPAEAVLLPGEEFSYAAVFGLTGGETPENAAMLEAPARFAGAFLNGGGRMQISSVSVWGDSIGKCVVFDEARGRYAICKDNYASHLKAGGVTVENHSVMGYTVCQAQLAEKDMRPGGVAAIEFGGNDCDLDWKAVSENPDIYHEARTPIGVFRDRLAEMVKKARAVRHARRAGGAAAHRRGKVLRLGVEKPQSQGDPQVSGRRAAHLPLAGALRAGGGGNRQQN